MSHAHAAIQLTRALLLALLLVAIPAQAQDLTNGLVLWWRLGEPGSASLYDSSPLGTKGTLTNGTTRILSSTGPALRFDGIDDYVTSPAASAYVFANTTFTVALRMKVTPSASSGYIFARRDSVVALPGYFARTETDGTLTIRIVGSTATAREYKTTVAYADGAWHHLAIIFVTDTATQAGNDIGIYVDGIPAAVVDNGGSDVYATTALPFTIGTPANLGGYVTGTLSDIRIYKRPLRPAEMLQLARETRYGALANPLDLLLRAMFPSPPVRHRSTLY